MSRSVPDDDMMDQQQAKDLGHATKSQPEQAEDAQRDTPAEEIEYDVLANGGLGRLTQPKTKSKAEEALEKAANQSRRS